MSWDVLLLNYGGLIPKTGEEPSALPLGKRSWVCKRIARVLPQVNWTDPTWGIFDSGGALVEFNMGDEDPVESIMLHVRASGDVVPLLHQLATANGWAILDMSSGEFLTPEEDSNSWDEFQEFRDRVLADESRYTKRSSKKVVAKKVGPKRGAKKRKSGENHVTKKRSAKKKP